MEKKLELESETIESLLNYKSNKKAVGLYASWIKATNQKDLTGTQVKFAQWCFDNKEVLMQMVPMFT